MNQEIRVWLGKVSYASWNEWKEILLSWNEYLKLRRIRSRDRWTTWKSTGVIKESWFKSRSFSVNGIAICKLLKGIDFISLKWSSF